MNKTLIFLFLAVTSNISHGNNISSISTEFQCNLPDRKFISAKDVDVLRYELAKRFVVVFGKNWESEDVPSKRIDEKSMADIAKVASCAAVVDKENGCALFYDADLGGTLSLITALPRTAPLRRQFDKAIKALPAGREKAAAKYCMTPVVK